MIANIGMVQEMSVGLQEWEPYSALAICDTTVGKEEHIP